ncbi:MAG: glycosyltransferase family A protein [Chitinophagaceae bacterium]
MSGLSAVIATYNRKDELKRLFDSAIANQLKPLELIVVDQNDNGLIDDLIRSYQDRLDIIHLKYAERQNSKARNFGAEKAKYPIICFPDDDCWYDEKSLHQVLNYFAVNPAAELLIIRWNQNPHFELNSLSLSFKTIATFKAPIGYAAITLFMKKEVFMAVKGFDATFGIGSYIGGGEDTDLIFKISSAGKSVYYDHTIGVNHLYNPSRNNSVAIIRSRQRGIGLLYSKYKLSPIVIIRGMLSPLVKILFSFKSDSIKQSYNMLAGRLEGYFYRGNK